MFDESFQPFTGSKGGSHGRTQLTYLLILLTSLIPALRG